MRVIFKSIQTFMAQKPSIPKGTRDFGPAEMAGRNYIFDTIRSVFKTYGYAPIETPSMENLSTLLGKYGEEGDKLLFRILNSGDAFSKINYDDYRIEGTDDSYNSKALSLKVCEKGLRYDLTVPFARFVVQHQNDISFPFKRFQIQPVWRADRPQKGRYREFYQCDVDVIGSTSQLNELELVQIVDRVFTLFDVNVCIKINNRKVLTGMAEICGFPDKVVDITVAIDKIDKIGLEAVEAAHVVSYKVYPNISKPSVVIETATVGTQSDDTLCIKAYFEGKLMGSATTKMASATTVMEIELAEAHLWECGNGRLYDLVFELTSGEAVDVMNGYFGLREVKLTKEKGLEINGKTVFGRFVLDQGFNPEGVITAPTDEALKFDIEASMACGFNGARLHQKVFEPRFLYHADKLGYMVWAEAGNWGFDHTNFANLENFLSEWLEEMERDFSHPSIIGWCPFNETWERNGHPQSISLIDAVYDITKAIDTTRPVVATSGSFPTTRTDVHDVHDYEQDPALFRSYYAEMDKGIARDQLHRMKPHSQVYKTELPVFMSEYGGIRWVMDDDNAGWGYGASVLSEDEFFTRLEGLTDAILENPHFFAFCYTQLTDVEQEQNGLLTYDRRFKFPAKKFARIFGKKSVIE